MILPGNEGLTWFDEIAEARGMARTICWTPLWSERYAGVGLEHLQLADRSAESVILAIDDERGPLRVTYRLAWDDAWRFREGMSTST
jgi:hypothetical protein